MIDVRKIGQRLTELRGLRSREEVARSLGVSTSALAMYELGYRMPKDDVKIKLAEFYAMPVGDLFFTPDVTNRVN